MSLLTMMQMVCGELNLTIPSAVIASNDTTIKQLLALSNREGQELAKRTDWSQLETVYNFPLANNIGTYTLPADFYKFVDRTMWDKNNHWELLGPMSPQEYEWRKNGITISTPRRRWRVFGASTTQMSIDPVPQASDAGDIMVYEYISTNWCKSAAGTGQTSWVADTDLGVLPENLLGMGLKWRFLKAKGLNYDEEFREYQSACDRDSVALSGAPALSISRRSTYVVGITPLNISETGFGQ